MSIRSLAVASVTLLAGCNLYFGDGDDDCAVLGAPEIADNQLRDPVTGECQSFGYPCDERCGPCPAYEAEPAIAQPDWATCFSPCEGLDESACVATAGCRAAYNNDPRNDGGPLFRECWAVAPSGPVQGSCEGLDAYECSRHDDCSAVYTIEHGPDDGIIGTTFAVCIPERVAQGCFSDEECGPGAHCSTSDGECLPPPGCDPSDPNTGCPAVCYGRCVNDGDACAAVDCGPGFHCEQQCGNGGCQPTCVPDMAGCPIACPPGSECVETCTAEDPNNPGCGKCTFECRPVGACEAITSEWECNGRGDCHSIYEGQNCTCYQDGTCQCEILTWERCATN